MNALDYGRDNRLRLWFLGEPCLEALDRALTGLGRYISAIHEWRTFNNNLPLVLVEEPLRGRPYCP
jgi:hypothetical protein